MSYKENVQIIIILWSNLKWEKPCFTSFTSLLLLANIGLDEEQEVRKLKGGKTQHEGGVKKAERGGGKKKYKTKQQHFSGCVNSIKCFNCGGGGGGVERKIKQFI